MQALVIYVGVKEENACPSALEMIIVDEFAQGMVHSITSTQEKSSGHLDFFVFNEICLFLHSHKVSSRNTQELYVKMNLMSKQ